jgi:precorrin-6B methylase 2
MLIAWAAVTVLTFGFPAKNTLLQYLFWAVRASGAACAILALTRDPEEEIFDPVAELTEVHRFQMAKVKAEAKQALKQKELEVEWYYAEQAEKQIQEIINHSVSALKTKEKEVLELKQQFAELKAHYEAEKEQLQASFQRQWNRLEKQTAEIEVMKNHLRVERDKLHAWVEKQSEEQFQEFNEKQAELTARRDKLQSQLEEYRNQLIEEFEKQQEKLEALYQDRYDGLNKVIDDQEKTIQAQRMYIYNLMQPEYLQGTNVEELLGNAVITFLYENGIIARSPWVTPQVKNIFKLTFAVLPVPAGKNQDKKYVHTLLEAFKRLESIKEGVKGVIQGCNTAPRVDIINRQIEMMIDISGIDWEAEAKRKSVTIEEPSKEHFENFVFGCSHVGLFAPTRFGKTVAINNILAIMKNRLGDGTKLIVGDAKLSTALRVLKPRYIGAKECLLGLREAVEEMERRVAIREDDYRNNRPLSTFEQDKRIYLWDEINEVILLFNNPIDPKVIEWLEENDFPKRYAVSTYLIRLWQMGAELDILTLIAGQNLMANRLKVNIVDLENLGLIFMGGAISVGINYRAKGSEKASLETQYTARRERYFRTRETDYKYYGLYALPNELPYFAAMPKPDEYVNEFTVALLDATPNDDEDDTYFREVVDLEDDFLSGAVDIQETETPGADGAYKGAGEEINTNEAPSASGEVQRLEDLVHLEFKCQHPKSEEEESAPFDPLKPGISEKLKKTVLNEYLALGSQNKVILKVWNVQKSGTNNRYLAAKWKLRKILHGAGRQLPGKEWGEDPNDMKSFGELFGGN